MGWVFVHQDNKNSVLSTLFHLVLHLFSHKCLAYTSAP